jgi:hypothetical protein
LYNTHGRRHEQEDHDHGQRSGLRGLTPEDRRRISQFIEELARPHVLSEDIDAAYRDMATDEAREREALAWSGEGIGDVFGNEPDAPR